MCKLNIKRKLDVPYSVRDLRICFTIFMMVHVDFMYNR